MGHNLPDLLGVLPDARSEEKRLMLAQESMHFVVQAGGFLKIESTTSLASR